uniref:Uncharacterized protein n=1 Tax=Arundo donax TaxID=35708 RepID=A0A0A9GT27_ARUDO
MQIGLQLFCRSKRDLSHSAKEHKSSCPKY